MPSTASSDDDALQNTQCSRAYVNHAKYINYTIICAISQLSAAVCIPHSGLQHQSQHLSYVFPQLIAFYFTYLLEDRHPGLADRVCLMPPGTTFLLLNSGMQLLH